MTLTRPGDLILSPALAHPGIQALGEKLSLKTQGSEVAARWIETDSAERLIGARRKELRLRNRVASSVFRRQQIRGHPLGLHVWLGG